ncbi:unnamed protein product [Lactuca virosa]|uniref:26S proteasome complex subunit SEM1 n=2 Tax=Lactuca TaxID=4235 RepID=A0AAU9M048_9ASTR|nr:unnamed protein product [Lactuca virosa]
MATTEQPKVVTEEAKIDLFEDDDEFEEFDINRVWDGKEEGKELAQQWEDDWDDDDVNDDFSLQLKKELENNADKKASGMSLQNVVTANVDEQQRRLNEKNTAPALVMGHSVITTTS